MMAIYIDPDDLPEAANRRYREAEDAVRRSRHLPRRNRDAVTRALRDVLLHRQENRGNNRSRVASHADSDLVRALEIFESEHSLARPKLEAYLLTDLTYEEIGERINESARVVKLFAQCFFDVRQEMSDHAVGDVVEAFKKVRPEQLVSGFLWKLVAVIDGATALEEIITPTEAQPFNQEKTAEAAKAIDVNDPNAGCELRRLFENPGDEQPTDEHAHLLEQIEAMYTSLGLTVGPPNPETTTPEAMEFVSTPSELKCEDTIRTACGLEPRNKEQYLAAQFPEARDDRAALSMAQTPCQEPDPAGNDHDGDDSAVVGDGTTELIEPMEEPAGEPTDVDTEPRLSSPEMEAKYKRDRVQQEKNKAAQKQADREGAATEAARELAEAEKAAKEAKQKLLDLEWAAFAGDSEGAIRHRKWIKFRKLHPGYTPEEARKQLALFKK